MTARKKNHDWLALTVEEPIEPDLPICDPHHHLWDGESGRVVPRYLLDEILEDVGGGHRIVSTVFIECGAMFKPDGPEALRAVGETEFVNGIAAMSALRLGAAAAPVLDAQIAAAGGRFRGIRLGGAWDPDPAVGNHRTRPPQGLFLRDDFRAGFALLAPRALTFEAWCYHRQIPDVTALARAFPDTTIVLDHFGGPVGVGSYAGRGREVHAEWRGYIRELATCPNVMAKLGGLNMEVNGFSWHEQPRPPSSQKLADPTRPYYEFTIEKFGVDRCMFESNFPVDAVSCSYTVLWNTFKHLTAGYSAAEKAKLFHDTATRVYRLAT